MCAGDTHDHGKCAIDPHFTHLKRVMRVPKMFEWSGSEVNGRTLMAGTAPKWPERTVLHRRMNHLTNPPESGIEQVPMSSTFDAIDLQSAA